MLIDQIGTNLSRTEKLASLQVTSVTIVEDVATVILKIKNVAGTVIEYPITL